MKDAYYGTPDPRVPSDDHTMMCPKCGPAVSVNSVRLIEACDDKDVCTCDICDVIIYIYPTDREPHGACE